MRERKNSLAMGRVHDGRRVRDLVGWGLRTERERESVVADSGVERERVWQWGGERCPNHDNVHLFFVFFF